METPARWRSFALNRREAAQLAKLAIKGAMTMSEGAGSIEGRANGLYDKIADRSMSFREDTAEAENDKDSAGKVQA
ncbi:MAG: hypothetical protein AAF264_05955 [Pseudomonadota bacterium]